MSRELRIGLDIGSTTVKIVVVEASSGGILDRRYVRHNAAQAETAARLLESVLENCAGATVRLAICGSGGAPFARILGVPYVQEVVAGSLAVRERYPQTRVAIELGGQDAKVVFFERDPSTGRLIASDMRMNGVCAGGTGAFIDQVAELLRVPPEEFEGLASRGRHVHEISGRCGVFAKTDIQPLLNQGVSREDIALSSFHAIVKQTVGGLAQGLEIRAPLVFQGGPLKFCPTLVKVFRERLGLDEDTSPLPEDAEVFVAWGAALSLGTLFADAPAWDPRTSEALRTWKPPAAESRVQTFFEDSDDRAEFERRHPAAAGELPPMPPAGSVRRGWLGIDAGSTTTKFVLLSEQGEVLDSFYGGNEGDPLRVVRTALLDLQRRHLEAGVDLEILGLGTTGYGELLFAKGLRADYHVVETVAHARAARQACPGARFVLDIGGQDMKAIWLREGVVTGIILNEACSSGCGSFVETYARSLGVPVDQVAPLAFEASNPSRLGSRCTVFMNSSIITEQRDGRSPGDILAGICRSIVENVFTKVVRVRNLADLGEIVVQGGTFRNDAVLRAFEQHVGTPVVRPAHPGLMGAIGIALLVMEHAQRSREELGTWESGFPGLDSLEDFGWQTENGQICGFCSNRCARTVVTFPDGRSHVTGNRCERGEIVDDPTSPDARRRAAEIQRRLQAVPDQFRLAERHLLREHPLPFEPSPRGVRIGIPRALESWSSLPLWTTFLRALGYEPVVSRSSDSQLFAQGLPHVPSDTVCFPAKLMHGHILDLVARKVDRILLPQLVSIPSDHVKFKATAVCPVIQGYPVVIRNGDDPEGTHGVPLDTPTFHWGDWDLARSQTVKWFSENWDLPVRAVGAAWDAGRAALVESRRQVEEEGRKILDQVRAEGGFAVVLAGRPYHADPLVNHHLSRHFTALGIPVLSVESLPGIHEIDLPGLTRMETLNSWHVRLLGAAMITAAEPCLELVQIVSFGCGHDATLTDETARLLSVHGGKDLLVLKLDEGDVAGPLAIRVKSFVATIRERRRLAPPSLPAPPRPFEATFQEKDRDTRTVLIPNLSPGFTRVVKGVLERQGLKVVHLPLADRRAIDLGKQFVHNDICYPAQINVGEALRWLELHPEVPQDSLALGLAKNCENCRAGQYSALARKALDEAGYERMPIVTTGRDTKNSHPGFRSNLGFRIKMLWGMCLLDGLDAMVRSTGPYALEPGAAKALHDFWVPRVADACAEKPRKGLEQLALAVEAFNALPVDRSVRKPRVGVLGEILMKYHPAANGFLEDWLEGHGMEVVRPGMLDFFRRDELIRLDKVKRGLVGNPLRNLLIGGITETLYRHAVKTVDKVMDRFRWREHHADCYQMVKLVEGMVDASYTTGEGWLIPAEILALASEGVKSFVIVQPFGCLANHISGRGLTKALKKRVPDIQILSLDYDPDTSFANVENRLQMLVLNARDLEGRVAPPIPA
ncbi:MAG: CoA activase [Fibrobacteria bacterium]|nr:CoA activase [Fibrobacteria bacterium]